MHCRHCTAGFALTFSACRDASSEPKPLLPVHVANVEMVRSDSAVRYSADIVPYAQVDLAFKSGGYVKSIPQVKGADGKSRNIDAGDRVAKGTVLAVVDQQDYKNKGQQANDQLARAQAEYNKAKLSFDALRHCIQARVRPSLTMILPRQIWRVQRRQSVRGKGANQ